MFPSPSSKNKVLFKGNKGWGFAYADRAKGEKVTLICKYLFSHLMSTLLPVFAASLERAFTAGIAVKESRAASSPGLLDVAKDLDCVGLRFMEEIRGSRLQVGF